MGSDEQKRADEAFDDAWQRHIKPQTWSAPKAGHQKPMTNREKLLAQADALDAQARRMIGCTYIGEAPWKSLRDQARLLRIAAENMKP